jgi:cbb3-type cytochrome oxidase subunit 3
MASKFDYNLFAVVSGFTIGPYFIISPFWTGNNLETLWLGIFFVIGGILGLFSKNIISSRSTIIIVVPLLLIGIFELIFSFINFPEGQRFILLIILTVFFLLIWEIARSIWNRRKSEKNTD